MPASSQPPAGIRQPRIVMGADCLAPVRLEYFAPCAAHDKTDTWRSVCRPQPRDWHVVCRRTHLLSSASLGCYYHSPRRRILLLLDPYAPRAP